MKIYHYDPVTNVFIGEGEADPSPLEPGKFLIPAYATEVAVPKIPAGMEAVWDGSKWFTQNIPEPVPPVPPEPTPEEKIQECKQLASILLSQTDWTQMADVAPTLENKSEFDAYRDSVRQYAINPVVDPVWPTKPKAVWKS